MLNRKFDLEMENCLSCGKTDVRITRDGPPALIDGFIYHFDLCMDCEDKVTRMMTSDEAQMTLFRLVDANEERIYGK